jgi:hypothetical protein
MEAEGINHQLPFLRPRQDHLLKRKTQPPKRLGKFGFSCNSEFIPSVDETVFNISSGRLLPRYSSL